MGILGSKTTRLEDLKKLGLKVPSFSFIDSEEVQIIFNNESQRNEVAKRLHEKLKANRYAVRSSALVEDSSNKSFAGQFKTELNVKPNDLSQAIQSILTQAYEFLDGDLGQFSVLIQTFIDPDFSGVTFTRNPLGGREMVVEYHQGIGEALVSGQIKPSRIEFFWGQFPCPSSTLPDFENAKENFQAIERYYKFPQDIEWCIKDGQWYFLQTRPITTISKVDYKAHLFLDKTLAKNKKFYFEKTEISEIASRPTPVTQDILRRMYEKDGPVQNVYKKYHIDYDPKPFLEIIGNELYVDREKELKTLLPAYSFFKKDDLRPHLTHWKGFLRTMKNVWYLNRLFLKNYKPLYTRLKESIESEEASDFFKDYELVFEINLLTSKAFKSLEQSLGKDADKAVELLSGIIDFLDIEEINFVMKTEVKGNSLEISDESKFIKPKHSQHNEEIKEWWESLSKIKRQLLEEPIRHAVIYNRLREGSRWLVVKNISHLRENASKIGGNTYFASLKEIMESKSIDDIVCTKRKAEYDAYSEFNFPKTLYYCPIVDSKLLQMVSMGEGEGTLVEENGIKNDGGPYILYTQNLEPRLAQYFDKIEGILSEQGSLLSHLAIIAREERIPVIVNFSLNSKGIQLGQKIHMNEKGVESSQLGVAKYK